MYGRIIECAGPSMVFVPLCSRVRQIYVVRCTRACSWHTLLSRLRAPKLSRLLDGFHHIIHSYRHGLALKFLFIHVSDIPVPMWYTDRCKYSHQPVVSILHICANLAHKNCRAQPAGAHVIIELCIREKLNIYICYQSQFYLS